MSRSHPNRFQLTLAATYRARQLAQGGTPLVEASRDKPTVVALREMLREKSEWNTSIACITRKLPRRAYSALPKRAD